MLYVRKRTFVKRKEGKCQLKMLYGKRNKHSLKSVLAQLSVEYKSSFWRK
jgi:hypothetical protein